MARQRHELLDSTSVDSDRRQRRVPSPLPPPSQIASQDDIVLVAARLATVEQQLTSFFSSIAAQANATRLAAEGARDDARADLEALAASMRSAIERLTDQSADDRKALRLALDARLADLSAHQDWRFAEVEARLERVAEGASSSSPGLDARSIAGPGVAAHEVDQRITEILGPVAARMEVLGSEVAHASEEIRRLDSNGAALHQYVSQIQGLVQASASEAVDAKIASLREQLGVTLTTLRSDLDAKLVQIGGNTDAAIANLRGEIDEAVSDRFTDVDVQLAALSSGIDQTLAALSARMTEAEATTVEINDRLVKAEQVTSKVDHKEIEHLRDKMQTAVGEAVLMRIEMDRLSGSLDERFDSVRVRLSEVEAQVADNMDVSAAVQLERLEELERAVLILSPVGAPATQVEAHALQKANQVPAAPTTMSTPVPPPPAPMQQPSPVPPPPAVPSLASAAVSAPVPPPPPAAAVTPPFISSATPAVPPPPPAPGQPLSGSALPHLNSDNGVVAAAW